jgi:hypothetical protein
MFMADRFIADKFIDDRFVDDGVMDNRFMDNRFIDNGSANALEYHDLMTFNNHWAEGRSDYDAKTKHYNCRTSRNY